MKFSSIIQAEELREILNSENLIIVDVRFNLNDPEWGRKQFQSSHIPGAQYAHLDNDLSDKIISGVTGRHPWPSIQKIESLFSKMGISHESQIVIYDQHHGGIAARFWAMCLYVGIDSGAVLNGGWQAWKALTYITSSEIKDIRPSHFIASNSYFNLVNIDQLHDYECVIDARASKRYQGVEEPIDPVAGHIPGAINLPFIDNLDSDYKWKSKEELSIRFKNLPKEDSVIYCGSGVTACHNLLALKYLNYPLADIYGGSWSHYITDPHREVATSEQ